MKGRFIIPVAVLAALAAGSAQAQNRGIAIPSERPGSGITFGQNGNLSFLNGGGGGGAGVANPRVANPRVANPRVANPGFAHPLATPAFGNPGFNGFTNQGFANQGFANQGFVAPGSANGSAFANGFVDPNTGLFTPSNSGFNGFGFDNGFNNGFDSGFNNGLNNGFNNGFDNGLNNGFNNGFNNQFFDPGFNGFGNGFFPGFGYGGGYPYGGSVTFGPTGWGQPLDPTGGLVNQAAMIGRRSPIVPVLGVNTPVAPVNGRVYAGGRTRVDLTPKTPEDYAARRLAPDQDQVASQEGTVLQAPQEGAPGPIRSTPATRDQVQLAARAEEIMAQRPMREGMVVRLNGDTVEVSYQCMGETRTEAFPAGEVFFFRTSGALATAATAKGQLKIGDRVLIACEENPPKQAVAGSRQEMRSSGTKSAPGAGGASTGSVRRSKPAHKH